MLTVSSIPDLRIIPQWHLTWKDKISHFVEYAIFALLFLLMLKQENRITNSKKTFFTVSFFGLLLAIIDELHQLFIPGRSTDVLDIVADSFGIVIVSIIFNLINNHRLRLVRVRKK